jgi:hypothetical protein
VSPLLDPPEATDFGTAEASGVAWEMIPSVGGTSVGSSGFVAVVIVVVIV